MILDRDDIAALSTTTLRATLFTFARLLPGLRKRIEHELALRECAEEIAQRIGQGSAWCERGGKS